MQITRMADYAIRAVIHLARHEGRQVPAARIARDEGIPSDYVAKVLRALSRAGIVASVPGRRGGSRLLRDAGSVSLLEVVEAVDGPLALNRCLVGEGECPRQRDCPVHEFWAETQRALSRRLSRAKVSRFCNGHAPRAPLRGGKGT